MGPSFLKRGVGFRVWAPNATAVSVIGDFNNWQSNKNPMASEENGNWYVEVPSAKPGQGYKYLLQTPWGERYRIDPYVREVDSSTGNGVIHDPKFEWEDDDFTPPSHNQLVIYEMHIGTFFKRGQKENQPSNFDTGLKKLGYLHSLGITAVEIMPIAEFSGDFSWGYNPAYIFAVESAYGGPQAFKNFVNEAHKKGIAVILDVVYNHFGPSDMDLWQFDGWQENEQGGIYFYNDDRSETPWGHTRPDYGRPEVRSFLLDNVAMWLDEYHVDGLRLDGAVYIRRVDGPGNHELPEGWSLLQNINQKVQAEYPGKITIAEDLQDSEWLTKPTSENGAGFHAQWDAAFVHPVRANVTEAQDEFRSMQTIAASIEHQFNDDVFQRVIYSESHDEVANGSTRVPAEVQPDDPQGWFAQKRSILAAALVFTAPGIPMIFQGQEFLEQDWFQDTAPLDWDQTQEFAGITRLYHDLITLRLNAPQNRRRRSAGLCGQGVRVTQCNEDAKMLVFHRCMNGGPGDDVIVVANFSNATQEDYTIGFPREGTWTLRFNSDAKIYSELFGDFPSGDVTTTPTENESGQDGFGYQGNLSIAPYSVLIYSQEE
ncbi:MAG: alpha-amylase family glycosyl hydrolase [Armatimonas sp.]